jgi:hypothetical protein
MNIPDLDTTVFHHTTNLCVQFCSIAAAFYFSFTFLLSLRVIINFVNHSMRMLSFISGYE